MLSLYKYRIPFSSRFATAAGSFSTREGLIVRFRNSATDIIAESAPLTGFSDETLEQVQTAFSNHRAAIEEFFSKPFSLNSLEQFTSNLPTIASFQFGVSTLGLIILSQQNRQSLQELLKQPIQKQVEINAIIGIGDRDHILNRISDGVKKGFRVFKIKAGKKPGELAGILHNASIRYPGISFRIDANRSWPIEQISIFSEPFSNLPVEYLEEPVRLSHPDQIDQLTEQSMLPIALDESIYEFGFQKVLRPDIKSLYYILKPMLLGNLIPYFATIYRYDSIVDRVIFTTALESVVGRRFITLLAAMYGSRKTAHGLNTGSLLSYDVTHDTDEADEPFVNNLSDKTLVTFRSLDSERLEKLY